MSEYLTKFKKIISDHSGIDKEEILEGSYFEEDLNIGEMELIEMLAELEETYHIELADSVGDFETVQDVVDSIVEQVE
ncbi:MAG: acyl carrier protein [Patescibacteria group bacterium]|nr:acyl carrier protein [Patescibacteria group bacterium]